MGDAFRARAAPTTKSIYSTDLVCNVAGHGMKIADGHSKSHDLYGEAGAATSGVVMDCPAIEVRSAYKSFGNSPVLANLNMTVDTGSIYSLLGSSGCGKTTLLLCVVGLESLDKGSVRVLGSPPGSACSLKGYMPQELALYPEFSIEESLRYYGRLYGMSREKIEESMGSILKLLELPYAKKKICNLSGGQKRRVSFAIATFHRPPLLILDEPTVGVDPILRESIWAFLRQLVASQKTSVVITTHYIEEARQSQMVGVMRNGRLLVEKSPQELIAQYKLPLLEQIVLALCQMDGKLSPSSASSSETQPPPPSLLLHGKKSWKHKNSSKTAGELSRIPHARVHPQYQGSSSTSSMSSEEFLQRRTSGRSFCSDCSFSSSLRRVQALTLKNFLVLIRSVSFLLFIFVVPALQIVLICLAIGPEPRDLGFGVINDEMFDNDSSPIALCNASEGCGTALSCKYLSMLPHESLNLRAYRSPEEAIEGIRRGNIWGYIHFPSNYSLYLIDRGGNPAFALDETYDGSRITFEMDMSNQQIGQNLKRIFIAVYYKYLVQVALDCALNPRQVELPLNFKHPIYGSDGTSFSEFLAPSVFLGLLFFFPLCSSGISYISEKKSGTLSRSLVAGVTTGEIMVAFLISQLAVLIVQSGLAFFILNVVFKITIMGSLPLGVSLAVLVGVGGMSMGFLISVICNEEIHAVLLAIGAFFPNFLLAGMVWPIQSMPPVLQWIAYLLPCTLACESMRSIVSRGWGLFHPFVWPGFASTIAWILIYWILTILLQQFKSQK